MNQNFKISTPKDMAHKLAVFFEETIWDFDTDVPWWKDVFFYASRLCYLVVRGITKNKSAIRATALAYTTLLSIVPLIAVMLAFFKAFGGLSKVESILEPVILNNLTTGSGETVKKYLVEFTSNLHAGALGIVGFIFLILTVIGLLSTIEAAFNDIWGVRQSRTWIKRFNAYWTIVTLGPLFVAFSIGLTASFQSSTFVKAYLSTGLLQYFLMVAPYLFTWVTFTLLYAYIPNTRVRFRSALLGGVFAGTLWEIAKYGYTVYAAQSTTYATIYGSLSALPVFLVWLYVTWLIVLIGAEVAFADQNSKTYRQEAHSPNVSQKFKEFLALNIVSLVCEKYHVGEGAVTGRQVSDFFKVPVRLSNELLFNLSRAAILLETGEEERYYCPAKPIDQIYIKDVIESLRSMGEEIPRFTPTKYMRGMEHLLKDSNKSFRDIITELVPHLRLTQK